MNLTPWFPADVLPVRKGVYEIENKVEPWFRRFDGRRWHCGSPVLEAAARRNDPLPTSWTPRRWRGLATPPEKP